MAEITERAILLAERGQSDVENIGHLGEGWTGEETLAIGIYCSLKYIDNFEEAMIAAGNMVGTVTVRVPLPGISLEQL